MTTITNITGKYEQALPPEATEKQRVETPAPAEETKTERIKDDTVSLSKESKDMQTAQAAVAAAPDVRKDKVNELKEAVNSGSYQVDAGKVAEKMIGMFVNDVA